MLGNRPEFHLVDLAAMTLGATPYSIYQTYSPEQIEYLSTTPARGSRSSSRRTSRDARRRAERAPMLEHVIVVDGEAPEGTIALADVEGADPDFDAAASRPPSSPTTS